MSFITIDHEVEVDTDHLKGKTLCHNAGVHVLTGFVADNHISPRQRSNYASRYTPSTTPTPWKVAYLRPSITIRPHYKAI